MERHGRRLQLGEQNTLFQENFCGEKILARLIVMLVFSGRHSGTRYVGDAEPISRRPLSG
jgi:hypothetical protein